MKPCVTDAALAIGIPLTLVLLYLLSARWWMPAMTRAHERYAGRVPPSWFWGIFATAACVEIGVGSLELARSRGTLDGGFAVGIGLAWAGLAMAYRYQSTPV